MRFYPFGRFNAIFAQSSGPKYVFYINNYNKLRKKSVLQWINKSVAAICQSYALFKILKKLEPNLV